MPYALFSIVMNIDDMQFSIFSNWRAHMASPLSIVAHAPTTNGD
jgi:hypothetical protein